MTSSGRCCAGLDDYVGLWEIADDVRRESPDATADEVRSRVVGLVSDLLKAGYMKGGHPTEDGEFAPWSATADATVARIDAEWRQLGGDPNIWQVCWFNLTPAGERVVQALSRPG